MVIQCAFKNCKNKRYRWASQSFHKFPVRDPKRTKLWLLAAGLDINPPEETLLKWRLCSDHFRPEDFAKPRNLKDHTLLTTDAVPSVFPDAPTASDDQIKEGTGQEPEGASMELGDPGTSPRNSHASHHKHLRSLEETKTETDRADSPQTISEGVSQTSSQSGGEPASTAECKEQAKELKNEKEDDKSNDKEGEELGLQEKPLVSSVLVNTNLSPSGSKLKAIIPSRTDENIDAGMTEDVETKDLKVRHDNSDSESQERPLTAISHGTKDKDQSDTNKDTADNYLEPLSCTSMDITMYDLEDEASKAVGEASKAVDEAIATTVGPSANPNADDLDEMMDMGTVDQVDQEAQMQDEEQRKVDTDSSSSPMLSVINTASEIEDSTSPNPKDTGEKSVKTLKEEDQPEEKSAADLLDASSSSHQGTASTGKNNASSTVANGIKNPKASSPKLDYKSSQTSTAAEEAIAPDTVRLAFSPSLVKVKDEPMDEEYDKALTSSSPIATIKDEPDKEEDLKISSVYSVGGVPGTAGSVSTAGLAKSGCAPSNSQKDPSAQSSAMPPLIPYTMRVACSHCKKVLKKGQTAFQRKGSPDLFCSTSCLSAMPLSNLNVAPPTTAPTTAKKTCHYCFKAIDRPQDVILAPVDDIGTMKDFCGQACLSALNYKRNSVASILTNKTQLQPLVAQSICSMCNRPCISKHEVILNGDVNKMCGDACFVRFRAVNNLTVAQCVNCGTYCLIKPLTLKLEDGTKTLCKAECLAKFKEKTKTVTRCTMCRAMRLLSDMLDSKDNDGKVELFCTSSCVMAYKVQTVSSSGAVVPCDYCTKATVPAYHLAMSDTSIRNFCMLPCVMAFQEKFNKKQVNVATKAQLTPVQTKMPAPCPTQPETPKTPPKLTCVQCHSLILTKPEVVQIKDKMVFLCGLACADEYKKSSFIMGLCENCKIEKVTKEVQRINRKDCNFCSEGCKLLYKFDLAKRWGKYCRCCAFCLSTSQSLVTGQYGGKAEDFCSDDCRSKYTMLFCQVAKCDFCGCQGKLTETLPMLGEAKHFCNMMCLLHFCSKKTLTQGPAPSMAPVPIVPLAGPAEKMEPTPVIANVVSLASSPIGQPNSLTSTTLQGAVPTVQMKLLGHASTQTDAVRVPQVPPPRILKNKALLCKPMVQNKGITCKTQTVNNESQTDGNCPSVIILPVPVPVFVPVPMNLYSQYTPRPLGLPIPLPVPMFLPVTTDSAERIIETIQDIKEKIPSNPFEADLILMAELVAEQDGSNEKKDQKGRVLEKKGDKPEGPVPDDHFSNYSDDLDTDVLASFLDNWDDPSSSASSRTPNRPDTNEKFQPIMDVPLTSSRDPLLSETEPPPPDMDLEADFPVETLELMAQMREKAKQCPSPPPAPNKRRVRRNVRDKKKKLRKSRRLANMETADEDLSINGNVTGAMLKELPKLDSKYGIDAWKSWIRWRNTQPNVEKPRFGSRLIELKEDVLSCTTAELSYGLSRFISEIKRPNGEPYAPDSLFYLCLGIQKYLFENSRLENIFTDVFYSKFSTDITAKLKDFKPSITATGYVHSRVEEDYLWDCKQLGAYSPIVLLNTLLFFCTKHFGFTTVEQHRQLSFAHVMRCTKTTTNNTKTSFLRFYPPISMKEFEADPQTDSYGVPVKKRKEEEIMLEMAENSENPLRCPVRLYEFYLSKCSESVKQRTSMFYLQPERCCVPNSPMWFSSTALDDGTMEAMLTRILAVRALHLQTGKEEATQSEQRDPDDPPFIPGDEDEEDSN